jgi:signal transduction histidine kinase
MTGLAVFVYLRVQHTLRDQAEEALAVELEALGSLPAQERRAAVRELSGLTFARVLSREGAVLASSPQLPRTFAASGIEAERAPRELPVRLEGDDEAEPALLRSRSLGGEVLVVGRSLEPVEEALDGVRTQFLLALPLALLLASGVAYAAAGTALRPVERMRRRADSISTLDTGARLPLPAAHDEIHRLAATLNEMLDRLDAAARRERDFVAAAGHELRTPLALLRMELDLALSRPRSPEEQLAALRSTSEEVERLTRLAEDLLLLADPEGAPRSRQPTDVPVGELLAEVARRYATLAESEGRSIEVATETSGSVRGDRVRLAQALGNLVHNAFIHGAGEVTLRAREQDGWVELRVEDEGPGVSPDRPDDPRGRGPGRNGGPRVGHGLGLAIVRMIAEEHGGTLEIVPPGVDGAGAVRLRLPRSSGPVTPREAGDPGAGQSGRA